MKTLQVKKIFEYVGHRDRIYSLSASANDDHFYSAGGDGMVVEWNYKTHGDGKLLVKMDSAIYSMCFIPGKKLLLLGSNKGNMHIIDLVERKEIRNIEAHAQSIFDIQHIRLNDIEYIITAGFDGAISFWEPSTYALLKTIRLSTKSTRCVAVHPQKREMAIGCSDHNIYIVNWDGEDAFHLSSHRVTTLERHTNSVFAVAYSFDGKRLLSGSRDVMLNAWDVDNSYQLVKTITAHLLHINTIAFNFDGHFFATGSMDKAIKLWDVERLELLKVIDRERNEGHAFSVNKIVWLSNRIFLSCGDDKKIMHWEIEEIN